MMKETVSKLANQVIAPFVKKMDNQQYFEQDVVDALFSNGVNTILLFILYLKIYTIYNFKFLAYGP